MNKNILYSEMNSLGSVLDSFMQNSAIKNGMKKATLFKFWSKVVGKKFENVSEAVSISNRSGKIILTVACASAAVTGELMMFKLQLLNKFNTFSKPLGVEIEDINFSHKIWKNNNSEENQNELTENPYKEDLKGFDPEKIEISDDEILVIKNNILKNSALSDSQQQRLLKSIIYDLKVQKFKSLSGKIY